MTEQIQASQHRAQIVSLCTAEEINRLDAVRVICDDYTMAFEWLWDIERQLGVVHKDAGSRPVDLSSRLRIIADHIRKQQGES